MYNPPRFRELDKKEVFDLMYHYPFATVITQTEKGPFVSHLPLTPTWNGEEVELIGHLATANPHSRLLNSCPVTVVFNGSHTYITPAWYAENDVPTWNYVVAHATGVVELYQKSDSIIECLKTLTTHVESLWPSGWDFFIPDDLPGDVLEKSIVGFRIKITDLNFKKKLSQNRTPADRVGILKGLSLRTDDNSIQTLDFMSSMYLSDGELKNKVSRSEKYSIPGVISKEAFEQQLEGIVHHIWRLQDRLGELQEFEKQWEELFVQLKNKTDTDCAVHIQNHNAYQAFHWDKYHIILSDMISLIENELDLKNKKSLFKQTIHHLELKQLEDYIRHDVKVHFSFYPHREMTEEEKSKEIEKSKLRTANDTFIAIQDSLKAIYPNIGSNFEINESDVKDLLLKVETLSKDLKSARHLFNHKLEETAKKRHTKGLQAASLENIAKTLDGIFQIVRNIGMVFKQTSYESYDFGSENEIADQIDIILFGSIQRALLLIYEKQDKAMYYWDARKKFYESDEVLDFVSNLPPALIKRRLDKYK